MNPTIEELIPLSQRVKEETLEVMKRSDLIRILEKIGSVNIIGSYLLDTMIDRDLDIIVKCYNPLKAAKASLTA